MANFRTHIATSSTLGIVYGSAGYLHGVPVETALLAGGLCGLSGALPDLDSDNSVPLRETNAFAAAVVPLLMIDRFEHLGLTREQIALAGAGIYLFIRFGVSALFKRYTVHRGMWHSVPAAAVATLLAFLICSCEEMQLRIFKAGGVLLGFMSHLLLDEFYSLEIRRGKLRIKRSFGTALKFYAPKSMWANVSTYAKLIVLAAIAFGDPIVMERYGFHPDRRTEIITEGKSRAGQWVSKILRKRDRLQR